MTTMPAPLSAPLVGTAQPRHRQISQFFSILQRRAIRGWPISIAALLVLTACGPSDKRKAEVSEAGRIDCLDKWCEGDVVPRHDMLTEEALKLNGRWFIGPKRYFTRGTNGGSFYWPSKLATYAPGDRPPEVRMHRFDEVAIEILLRSNNIPPPPRGYAFVELAEQNKWVADRRTLRPGLDEVRMKSDDGPEGRSLSHLTYYVATNLVGTDGLPPVAGCSHDTPRNGGGSGFMWKPGIWAGIRMNQRHCADWPEIYQEIARVMQLLREAP